MPLPAAPGSTTISAMARTVMHPDQVPTDAALVRRLLAGQFPQWADLPVEPVTSSGTDHDIYRVGDDLSVRLPRIAWATGQAAKEAVWLPRLAPHLPLAVPVQLAMGHPAEGYPFAWSVYEWVGGTDAAGLVAAGTDAAATSSSTDPGDLERAAVDLAAFVTALRRIDTTGAPRRPTGARGAPLAELDQQVQESIDQLGVRVDAAAARRSWEQSLGAPSWPGPDVWLHGDLLPGNLIVSGRRLTAVIDFGALGVGDPACDLQPAWNVFTGTSRLRYRDELAVDDASWLRGRGWALYQAVSALPYYWDTNPGMVAQATRALAEVLADDPG